MKVSPVQAKCHEEGQINHPNHSPEIPRLRRVCGQVEGIEKMVSERRYCPDILVQIRAASAALRTIERSILGRHLRACVKSALNSKNEREIEKKLEELMNLLSSHQR